VAHGDTGKFSQPPLPSRLARPLENFLSTETLGGLLLLAAAVVALVWANLPNSSYNDFWSAHIGVDLDVISLELTLAEWVNDALMAVFFFVVGMEIKRELLRGELADRQRAALPVAAAIGGMVVPALIYVALNAGGEGADGWGIPMATDIAFAVGMLALLGTRAPTSLKVFLLALAIVDDLGAILVIALFYTDDLALEWLAVAGALLALIYAMGRAGIRDALAYVVVAVVTWVAVHESGVHATIAGVALGLLTPIDAYYSPTKFSTSARGLLADLEAEGMDSGHEETRSAALRDLEALSRESQPVLDRLLHGLHPWTSYIIVPIFALANAGVELSGESLSDAVASRITAGVVLGLAIGKPLGIVALAWLAVRLGIAALPDGVGWRQITGAGLIAGIGFTVSIFIANLAFKDPALVEQAKIGVLGVSVLMGLAGVGFLYFVTRPETGGDTG